MASGTSSAQVAGRSGDGPGHAVAGTAMAAPGTPARRHGPSPAHDTARAGAAERTRHPAPPHPG